MKQTRKAIHTQEKILQAANDLFYQHGYNGTGLDRIIAAAGVAKGSFYHHFNSKEELAAAVVDWHKELAFAEIRLDRILARTSPLKALFELVEAMLGRMRCDSEACHIRGCFFGNFALELANESERVRYKVEQVFDAIQALIQDLLTRAQAAEEIPVELDCQATAGMILSLMEGAVLLDKSSQTEARTQNALAFLHGYLNG